jgi:hypothetical protein
LRWRDDPGSDERGLRESEEDDEEEESAMRGSAYSLASWTAIWIALQHMHMK